MKLLPQSLLKDGTLPEASILSSKLFMANIRLFSSSFQELDSIKSFFERFNQNH